MTPEETFGQLLGLGKAWRVVEARLEASSSTFVLSVKETAELWPEESARAGTKVTCHDHVEPMQWRHLNVFNKECVIVCALPRGRRGDDGKVYRVTPPWEGRSKHFTQEFEAFALTLMREMPVKRAGQILGESEVPSYKFDLQAAVKTVPTGCISDKEYTEWMNKPAYLKTQTISLTSIINGPLIISAKFTPDLNQEMATEVSYRWTKIK